MGNLDAAFPKTSRRWARKASMTGLTSASGISGERRLATADLRRLNRPSRVMAASGGKTRRAASCCWWWGECAGGLGAAVDRIGAPLAPVGAQGQLAAFRLSHVAAIACT